MQVATTSGIQNLEFVILDKSLEIVFLSDTLNGETKVRVLWNVQKFPRICNELIDRGISVKMPLKGDKWDGFGRNPEAECFVSRTERAWNTVLINPFPHILLGT